MAQSVSANKRIRQNATHRARNRWRLRTMRLAIKSFHEQLAHGSVDEAVQAYRAAARQIDRSLAKGVIHKNQAARRKSRLNTLLKAKASA